MDVPPIEQTIRGASPYPNFSLIFILSLYFGGSNNMMYPINL
jgi:hypothetical protein